MQEDVKEWAQAMDEGLTTEYTSPVELMQKLLIRGQVVKRKESLLLRPLHLAL